jgi:hypothetical protein
MHKTRERKREAKVSRGLLMKRQRNTKALKEDDPF